MSKTKEKNYNQVCDYCLEDPKPIHCFPTPPARGCHETFISLEVYRQHFHELTGGCKFPGNVDGAYLKYDEDGEEIGWDKKQEKENTPGA